jgi:hypothetical protein
MARVRPPTEGTSAGVDSQQEHLNLPLNQHTKKRSRAHGAFHPVGTNGDYCGLDVGLIPLLQMLPNKYTSLCQGNEGTVATTDAVCSVALNEMGR